MPIEDTVGAIQRPDDLPANHWRRMNRRFQGENFDADWMLVDAVRGLAAELGITAAQLALAWLLHEGAVNLQAPVSAAVAAAGLVHRVAGGLPPLSGAARAGAGCFG